MAKCRELSDVCVGFIRLDDGRCYFRGVSLRSPTSSAGRACFRPNELFPIQQPTTAAPDAASAVGDPHIQTIHQNKFDLEDDEDDETPWFEPGLIQESQVVSHDIKTPEPDFEKMEGMDCQGTGGDILRGFRGNDAGCMAKCRELGDACVGFIRLDDGRCYFRGVSLRSPTSSAGRACFRPNELFPIQQPTTAAPDAASAVGDPHIQTIHENKFDLE